ncbi:aminotransferase class I/II-fold pyridoxal phosphate-dependent enzyme [Nocardioides sp. W3-2-3]|nr:aminotransferase class I/II-fold pyridoxal phosphate-dependent enzyme [Nocardioides convexus]
MDCVPGERESLAGVRLPGLVVVRSLTKHWGIPGIRAGYVVGDALVVAGLALNQTPWSVGSTAAAAVVACTSPAAVTEARRRAEEIRDGREHLEKGLADLGIEHLPSTASFVLARVGAGVHDALRDEGIAVRRADTFPGLDGGWVRIAVRRPEVTDRLIDALRRTRPRPPSPPPSPQR